MRRALAIASLLVVVVAIAACTAGSAATSSVGPYRAVVPSLSREYASGIQGIVTIGPTCPVERPDSPCPDRDYPTTIVVSDTSGNEVARQATDANGEFIISLPSGDYSLTEAIGTSVFPHPVTLPVHVDPDAYTFIHVMLDSGIR